MSILGRGLVLERKWGTKWGSPDTRLKTLIESVIMDHVIQKSKRAPYVPLRPRPTTPLEFFGMRTTISRFSTLSNTCDAAQAQYSQLGQSKELTIYRAVSDARIPL